MRSPLVTVYITNYNYGDFIAEAIESVINQTLTDFQLLVIDDGSTDQSHQIIKEYAAKYPIEVVFQQNKGLNITNNIALRAARGKYIVRLDADDYFHPQALEKLTSRLEVDPELGLVFPDYYLVNKQGEILEEFKRHDFDNDVSLLDQAAHGACTMIRSQFLRNLGGYNESFSCQDGYELWVKFTEHYKVANISEPLFYYRQHGTNLTRNETRILSTRARINELYSTNRFGDLHALALIPVRNEMLALRALGDKKVIDYKVDAALGTTCLDKIVVSSPSKAVGEHIESRYGSEPRVYFHLREEENARLNVSLVGTVESVLEKYYAGENLPDAISILTIEYPLTAPYVIADAIHTMYLFKSDSLISVRQENNMLFQHLGSGMQAILNQDKVIKLEREALYKQSGGITVVKTEKFLKEKKILVGRIGHMMMDQQSSMGIFTDFDFQLMNLICSNLTKAVTAEA